MKTVLVLLASVILCAAQSRSPGRPATDAEIRSSDMTVLPNGAGLPPGRGDAVRGAAVFKEQCAVCHNDNGEGREGQYPALVGGIGTLRSPKPLRTVGSFWPYATTILDYVRRAMPYDHPRSLSSDDLYAVTAFILYKNGIITERQEMNEKSLPAVKMPNRDGFIPDARPDVKPKK